MIFNDLYTFLLEFQDIPRFPWPSPGLSGRHFYWRFYWRSDRVELRVLRCIDDVPTTKASPWQNPFVERLFGSLRRELFDHVIVLNVGNALRLLAEYFENYYHIGRPHQGLDGQTPKNEQGVQTEQGKVVAIPVLGGLHHRYERMAA